MRLPTGKHNLLIVPSIIFVGVAIVSLCLAVYYPFQNINPSIYQTTNTLKSETGQIQLFIPNPPMLNTTATSSAAVEVFCTVNSTSFVQGDPSIITVTLKFSKLGSNLIIDGMQVEPIDALGLYNATYSNTKGITYIPFNPPAMSILNPIPISVDNYTDQFYQTWQDSQGVIFQDSGAIQLNIRIYAEPSPSIAPLTNMTGYDYTHYFLVDVPIINIISQSTAQQTEENLKQQIQQQNNQNMNLSLTFFVATLASLGIAVVFYDHSKDKDKEAECEARKAEKKRREIAKQGQEIV
jgi:hypothetical protein